MELMEVSNSSKTDFDSFSNLSFIKKRKYQRQLYLLVHAFKCQGQESTSIGAAVKTVCYLKTCKKMKLLVTHIQNCNSPCKTRDCASAKSVWEHWKQCKRRDCKFCEPLTVVRKKVRNGPLHNKNWHLDHKSPGSSGLRSQSVLKINDHIKSAMWKHFSDKTTPPCMKSVWSCAKKNESNLFNIADTKEEYCILIEKLCNIILLIGNNEGIDTDDEPLLEDLASDFAQILQL